MKETKQIIENQNEYEKNEMTTRKNKNRAIM